MIDSNRVTELNHKSLALTDAELALVDKFSVLLPMSELPEIIVGQGGASDDDQAELPESAIIPFENPLPTDGNRQQAVEPPEIDSKPESATDEQKDDEIEPDILAVDFPKDELSISSDSPEETESVGDDDASQTTDGEDDEASYDILQYGKYHERFEQLAKQLSSNLEETSDGVVLIASPDTARDQDLVFSSLLIALSRKSPEKRIIAVQGMEPDDDQCCVSVGLGQVLSDEHLLEDVVIPTSIDNLDYLGYSDSSLSSQAYRNRMYRMFDELKRHYDLILFNARPAATPETLAISDMADACYLLIRSTDAEKEPVLDAVKELRKKGARLAGCILTSYQREAS